MDLNRIPIGFLIEDQRSFLWIIKNIFFENNQFLSQKSSRPRYRNTKQDLEKYQIGPRSSHWEPKGRFMETEECFHRKQLGFITLRSRGNFRKPKDILLKRHVNMRRPEFSKEYKKGKDPDRGKQNNEKTVKTFYRRYRGLPINGLKIFS